MAGHTPAGLFRPGCADWHDPCEPPCLLGQVSAWNHLESPPSLGMLLSKMVLAALAGRLVIGRQIGRQQCGSHFQGSAGTAGSVA